MAPLHSYTPERVCVGYVTMYRLLNTRTTKHVKSPGFARSLPVLYYISWSPGGSSKSPGFQWNPNKQILPNFPNWVWIIGFISGRVLSRVFLCVASLWQCQLTNSGNCNRVWDWANLMLTTVTTSKYKQRHQRLGQQIEQWPELELFKSHLPLNIENSLINI